MNPEEKRKDPRGPKGERFLLFSLDKIPRAMSFLAGFAVLLVTLMVTFDVLMRYFLNEPQLFVDELASFILVFIIFGGLAHTFQQGGHIRVDLLTNRLKAQTRRALRILTLSLGTALLAVITWNTSVSSIVAYRLGRLSMVMFYPLWIFMLLIPLGVAFMALVMGAKLVAEIRYEPGKDPEKSPAELSKRKRIE